MLINKYTHNLIHLMILIGLGWLIVTMKVAPTAALTPVLSHPYNLALDSESILASPPPLPASFYGTVAGAVNTDTAVTAVIGNETVAQATLMQSGEVWVYRLIIPGDNPDTKAREGGSPGDTVTFHIDDQSVAQTAVWQSGSNTQLNLTPASGTVNPYSLLWLLSALAVGGLVLASFYRRRAAHTPPAGHVSLQENRS